MRPWQLQPPDKFADPPLLLAVLLACCSDAGEYEGEAQNLVWRQDPSFGEVLDCDEVGG